MSIATTNLGLIKPEATDNVSLSNYNSNLDIIDEKINATNDKVDSGWIPLSDSGTYVSNNEFYIAGDFSGVLTAGMRINLTNSTSKYFTVSAVAYSSENTTITTNETTLVSGTITDISYSLAFAPIGFVPADYPIARGTTDGWTWKKYASGEIKCYRVFSTGTININTAYGNMFMTSEISIAIPSTILTIKDISHSVYLAGGIGGLTLSNTDVQINSSRTIKYWLWSATSLTNKNPQVYFEIKGTWK